MRVALYQPDMPQNAAAVMRLAACLGVPLDIIEPCGFLWDDKRLRRVGLDYWGAATIRRHSAWDAFRAAPGVAGARVVLLTTQGAVSHLAFAFRADDVVMLGRESAGVPETVHAAVDARLTIPMAPGARSLNVAAAAAVVLGEALRQTDGFPAPPADG
ncbi:tRNA (cytidine(34)-2'-O)-methyltransferase [Roseospira goensis]|uniref:tRNA (cytidine(34)-2'-O)-methyltransferase n=1 Tax=Roseospira goensis TaxID=391922 RepID=A0A7W6RXW3_9PROT|nr:tRNA (cytidine(34)-2'-O)-methyltransferase [Roseospira goensis]MBB4285233.1 tRNA (cytidine/uridine-2'-O-)-methyltransferase [Roseospira goensis]